MKRRVLTVGVALMTLCAAVSALAQGQLLLTQGESVEGEIYQGTRDAILINGDFAARHYGTGSSIWVGTGPRGDESIRRSLLAFDLTGLPEQFRSAKVRHARLKLRCMQVSGAPFSWQIYPVTLENAVWKQELHADEKGAVGREGKALENVCSWNYRANFYQQWSGGPGLGEPGGGYAEVPLYEGSTASEAVRVGATVEVELPAELVQEWLKGENGGVLLRMQEEEGGGDQYIRFGSSEHTKAGERPVLEIEFES